MHNVMLPRSGFVARADSGPVLLPRSSVLLRGITPCVPRWAIDWDSQGYQKRTGWIGANYGMLVIDHDLNNSVDTGKELLSNPLIADQVKGLRSLVANDFSWRMAA